MQKEEIVSKLRAIDIDTNNIIIGEKKTFPKDGVSVVGMYSRELKWDFWFWSDYEKDLFCLKACWKDRKKYPTENFQDKGIKYQVPLSDFLTYDQIGEQFVEEQIKKEKLKGLIIDLENESGIFIGDVLQPESPESIEYKKELVGKVYETKMREVQDSPAPTRIPKKEIDASVDKAVKHVPTQKEMQMIGSRLRIEFASPNKNFTMELEDITGEKLDILLDIIRN